jgi:hypothetical protein
LKPAHDLIRRTLMRSRLVVTVLVALLTLPLLVPPARAQNTLVVSVFSRDAQSQNLMKTGQGPVQVMLSVNAYHLQE